MKRNLMTLLITLGLIATVLAWPDSKSSSRLTTGASSVSHARAAKQVTLNALFEEVAPTGLCFTVYDCDAARRVCWDMADALQDVCLIYGNDPIKCGDDAVNYASSCVTNSTNGQCNIDSTKDRPIN